VIAISVGLFALLWAMVGGQMAVGNDPVLGSKGSSTGAKKAPRASKPAQPPSQFNDSGTQLAIDPRTGQVVVVPAPSGSGSSSPPDSGSSSSSSSSASQAAPQPSYTAPPVTSSTS
jgi:hypothetical protein